MEKCGYTPDEGRYVNGMKYRRCGKSGIMLPEISLGFWHNFGDVDSFENARAMVLSRSSYSMAGEATLS